MLSMLDNPNSRLEGVEEGRLSKIFETIHQKIDLSNIEHHAVIAWLYLDMFPQASPVEPWAVQSRARRSCSNDWLGNPSPQATGFEGIWDLSWPVLTHQCASMLCHQCASTDALSVLAILWSLALVSQRWQSYLGNPVVSLSHPRKTIWDSLRSPTRSPTLWSAVMSNMRGYPGQSPPSCSSSVDDWSTARPHITPWFCCGGNLKRPSAKNGCLSGWFCN